MAPADGTTAAATTAPATAPEDDATTVPVTGRGRAEAGAGTVRTDATTATTGAKISAAGLIPTAIDGASVPCEPAERVNAVT